MPRKIGYGRPGTQVIPKDWAANMAPVVENTLDCEVTIAPAGTAPAWNETNRQTETSPQIPVYDGPAAITPATEDAAHPQVAEDTITTRTYVVKLNHAAAGIEDGHVITIKSSPDPDWTKGHRLRVTAVEDASRRFSRVLRAVDAT